MIRAATPEQLTLEEWAASPWRPCCGTCRRPVLYRSLDLTCSNCGDPWDGSEASAKEAAYRLSQAAHAAAVARIEAGP